uniref:G-protein coupled receptors family 1 profile domain-containing protein n=1 Tax=Panagrolaimus sp. JU765 TaxID=591449 RepID=A0AC34QKR8_9BILA
MDVRTVRYYVNAIISPLGIVFNCLLLYAVATKTNNQMSKYRKVIYLGIIIDLIFGIGATVFAPSTATYDGLFFITLDGLAGHLQSPFITYGYVYIVFANYLTVTALPVQYIYRLLVVCFNKNIKWHFFTILFSFSLGACLFLSWECLIVPAETITPIMDDKVRIIGWADPVTHELPAYGVTQLIYVVNVLYTGYFIIFISYLIIILCSIAVFFKFKRQLMLTTLDFKIHRQITLVLMIEALTPFITIVLPILSDLVTASLRIDASALGPARKILTCMHPFFNPILKCFIIGDCRKAFMSLLRFLLIRENPDTVVTIRTVHI